MKRPRWSRKWIPGIVFWVLFLGSIALDRRHPWVRTVWVAVWFLFLVFIAAVAVVQIFRHREDTAGIISHRGVPAWAVTLFGGGPEPGDRPARKSPV